MNNTHKNSRLSFSFIILSFLLAISTNGVMAAEKEIESKIATKVEAPEKTCLKLAQLKPEAKKTYIKCVKHTYNKSRCYKKVNLCLN